MSCESTSMTGSCQLITTWKITAGWYLVVYLELLADHTHQITSAVHRRRTSGRGKGGKGLGKGGAKRHRKVLHDIIQGITKPAIRRLACRGPTSLPIILSPEFQSSRDPMIQCSSAPVFQRSNDPVFQCSSVPEIQ